MVCLLAVFSHDKNNVATSRFLNVNFTLFALRIRTLTIKYLRANLLKGASKAFSSHKAVHTLKNLFDAFSIASAGEHFSTEAILNVSSTSNGLRKS